MKKNYPVVAGLCLVVASLTVQAADVRVKGAIAPASCSFTLTRSVIDYGTIHPSSLSPTSYTKLDKKSVPYTVRCSGQSKIKVGIKSVDNRAGSRIPGMMLGQFGGNYKDLYNFGLGATSRGQKIGGYVVHLRNSVADGKSVGIVSSENNGVRWEPNSTQAVGHTANIASWRAGNVYAPILVNAVSGNVEVQAVINKTSELDMGNQINLDGHFTLELRYL